VYWLYEPVDVDRLHKYVARRCFVRK